LIHEEERGVKTLRVRRLKTPTFRRWIPFLAHPDQALVYYRKFAAVIRKGFARYVAKQGLPDVIHAHVVQPAGWVAVELGQNYGIPVVLTEHSGPFDMHLRTDKQRSLVRDILRCADRLVAVSPALRDAMMEFYPDARIDVIGNLIDTEFFTPASGDRASGRPFCFFYLGVFVEIKGVQHLLHAIQSVLARGLRNFEVHLGGDGPLGSSLKTMAVNLGIADRCRFLGMLSREEVREQMRACDVFVLPSLGETFGIVNGEAMACGKPVLSTRCGGPEYVVTPETGILVTPGNPQELADAMASFLNHDRPFDPERIRASVVQRLGAGAFLEKTEAVYADVAENVRMSVSQSEPEASFH
jgi:L-malate glycosyltransferase